MNVQQAGEVLKEFFGPETKWFAREDPISGNKKILRPLEENEETSKGRCLIGERLEIMGQGKIWEHALAAALKPEMIRRKKADAIRAATATHEGELFAVFLREKLGPEFESWRIESETAKIMQAAFDKALAEAQKEEAPNE